MGRLGLKIERTDNVARCSFAYDEESPNCNREAKWHALCEKAGYWAAVSACDLHLSNANDFAQYVHVFGSACGLPGSIFIVAENRCKIPDDDFRKLLMEDADAASG